MKVFADLHQGDLYYSLQLLFVKRLGWELYRPIGEDWFTQGYWKIAEPYGNDRGTIRQYLGTDTHNWEQYKFLNGDYVLEDGIYNIYDPISGDHQKAITFQKFKEMDIDIVISTYQPHDLPYADLVRRYKPKAKHIVQMGNIYQSTDAQNVMCSTVPYEVPAGKNVVFYHQEFDLNTFVYIPPTDVKKITSFVNLLPQPEIYNYYKEQLRNVEMKAYGALCPDGTITGHKEIAKIMQESFFGYHVKPMGDGFGHIIHNWYAVGRPVLTYKGDYQDKLAGELLEDGVTCFDLGRRSHDETIALVKRTLAEPEKLQTMCDASYNRFRELVDFDKEFEKIKQFLDVALTT